MSRVTPGIRGTLLGCRSMGRIPGDAERSCIELFCQVLRTTNVSRQHRFDFLRGDPTRNRPVGVPLPVDAYFPDYRLVVEYMGEQHSASNALMDRRPGRREQRATYQERRARLLREHGYRLVRVWHHEPLTEVTVRAKLKLEGLRMAELDPEAAQRLMSVFMSAYNAQHGTHYDRFTEGAPGADADYVCESSAGEPSLKVQHTRAWGDARTEWSHPADVHNFVMRQIVQRLRDRGITNRFVSLTVQRLPAGRKEKILFAEALWTAIEFGLNKLTPADPLRRLVLFDRLDWEQLYAPIQDFVPELEVFRREPPDGRPANVGWSPDGASTEGVLDAAPRMTTAVRNKEERYRGTGTDLVLIVDFEVMPYFADEVARMQDSLRGDHPFKEIWVSSPWLPPMAHQIWPT